MPFSATWAAIQGLGGRTVVPNWTAASGSVGDPFKIVRVAPAFIEVEPPKARNSVRVPKREFGELYLLWSAYCARTIDRGVLAQASRKSKYIISILRLIEIRSGGTLP